MCVAAAVRAFVLGANDGLVSVASLMLGECHSSHADATCNAAASVRAAARTPTYPVFKRAVRSAACMCCHCFDLILHALYYLVAEDATHHTQLLT